MSGLAWLKRIRAPELVPREPTLVDWVSADIAPPGRRVTDQQQAILDGLVNRSAARGLMRGRGPYQHFRKQHSLEEIIRAARGRVRRRRRKIEQRLR